MNNSNNKSNFNNSENFSFNEKQFKLQMEKNLKWDQEDLIIRKTKNSNIISSSNVLPNFNLNSSVNNVGINKKEQSSNPFPVKKISLVDIKNFDINLSEELLIQYRNNETFSNQPDPNKDDEVYSVEYSPVDNNLCEGK